LRYGAIEFWQAATDAGIKPVIGMESYLARGKMSERLPGEENKPYHLLLLAKDMTGYKNLLKLASLAQLQGFYYKPRIDKDTLAAHSAGLICTTGCLAAEIPRLLTETASRKAGARLAGITHLWRGELSSSCGTTACLAARAQ
jgi:DNA polymerase-3 subunit alpha